MALTSLEYSSLTLEDSLFYKGFLTKIKTLKKGGVVLEGSSETIEFIDKNLSITPPIKAGKKMWKWLFEDSNEVWESHIYLDENGRNKMGALYIPFNRALKKEKIGLPVITSI